MYTNKNQVTHSLNFKTSQYYFLSSNWLFVCEHLFINKPMFTTEPAVPAARFEAVF